MAGDSRSPLHPGPWGYQPFSAGPDGTPDRWLCTGCLRPTGTHGEPPAGGHAVGCRTDLVERAFKQAAEMWDDAASEAERDYEPSTRVTWYRDQAAKVRASVVGAEVPPTRRTEGY